MIIRLDTFDKSEQLQFEKGYGPQEVKTLSVIDRVTLHNLMNGRRFEFPLIENKDDLLSAMDGQIQHLSDVIESGDFVDQENFSKIDLITIRAMLASALYHFDPDAMVIGK